MRHSDTKLIKYKKDMKQNWAEPGQWAVLLAALPSCIVKEKHRRKLGISGVHPHVDRAEER